MEIRLIGSFPKHPFDSTLSFDPKSGSKWRGHDLRGGRWPLAKSVQWVKTLNFIIGSKMRREGSRRRRRRGGHKCTRVGKTRAVRHLSSVAPIPSIQMVAPWFLPNLEPLHWIKWSLLSSLILRIWFFISGLARSKTCLFDSFHLWFGTSVNSDIVNTKQLYIKYTLHS